MRGELLCGHHKGTYVIKNKNAVQVATIQGTWNLDLIDDQHILQGNYDGLYVLEKKNGQWSLRNKLDGFNNSARYFEIVNDEILVNHEYKGVFEIKVDEQFSKAKRVTVDSSLKGYNSGLLRFGDELLFSSRNGIYKYADGADAFVKDEFLSSIYDSADYVSGRMIPSAEGDKFWMFTQ